MYYSVAQNSKTATNITLTIYIKIKYKNIINDWNICPKILVQYIAVYFQYITNSMCVFFTSSLKNLLFTEISTKYKT